MAFTQKTLPAASPTPHIATVVAVLIIGLLTNPSFAESTPVQISGVTQSQQVEAEMAARQWDLTTAQWREYQAIMQGKRGIWSPGLDPVTALGVHAETAAARQQLAELYVTQAFARTEKELAFQRAVNAAWSRLFPNHKRLHAARPFSPASMPASRYALVVTPDCAGCDRRLRDHLRSAATIGVATDIYLVDSDADDATLRAWADLAGITAQDIEAGRITLNHGEQFAELPSFPVVYARQGDGQWVVQ